MTKYGIITKIYKKENRTIDIGEVMDIESGYSFPFEAPSGRFEAQEKVRYEPSSYTGEKVKEVRLFKAQ